MEKSCLRSSIGLATSEKRWHRENTTPTFKKKKENPENRDIDKTRMHVHNLMKVQTSLFWFWIFIHFRGTAEESRSYIRADTQRERERANTSAWHFPRIAGLLGATARKELGGFDSFLFLCAVLLSSLNSTLFYASSTVEWRSFKTFYGHPSRSLVSKRKRRPRPSDTDFLTRV